tara:strand:- start:108 stop:497 length:390 start_codon:yes stop_codon:yes gene_type:complete
MKSTLPSNKKFGFFFSIIFFIAYIYFLLNDSKISYLIISLFLIILSTTLFFPDKLAIFNKAWLNFGLMIGTIVSPIVLGIIFFIILSPIAIVTRITGRDELKIDMKKKNTHWIKRSSNEIDPTDFRRQY